MAYCRECGSEVDERNKYCTSCGNPMGPLNPSIEHHHLENNGSFGWFFLGLFFPLVGFILFLVWIGSKKKSAYGALIGSVVSFVLVFVLVIVAAFAIPATGNMIEDTQRDAILADALAIENAAKLYCSQTTCDSNQSLTWTELQPYINGLDTGYYDFTNNNGIIATKFNGVWTVDLEASGTGEWEFVQGAVPSASDRDQVVRDMD